ncbi:hypothetical protein NL868_001295 [Shigella flexneri]|nr:hypothetical protein [Shigella flexneri]
MDTKQIIQSIIKDDDPYIKEYGKKYIQKIGYLYDLIFNKPSGEGNFNVVNFEAGLGKSKYTDAILRWHIENQWAKKDKFLVVKRFNEEAISSAAYIQQANPFLIDLTAVVTADSWKRHWRQHSDRLKQATVIFISHKRYIDLCLNDKERTIFMEGRTTLIIDEKINFPIYTYTYDFYSTVRGLLQYHNSKLFDEVCEPLNLLLEDNKKTKKCFKVSPKMKKKKLENFKSMMESELNDTSNLDKKRKITEFIDTLNNLYEEKTQAVINNNKICTLNRKHKHWGLQNNLILDASASIDGVYYVNPKFELSKQTPFIDHKDSKFIHFNVKSSQSEIEKNKHAYIDKLTDNIIHRHKENDRTLIVIHKKFSKAMYDMLIIKVGRNLVWKDKDNKLSDPDYLNQEYAISWYGNLIGKNWASDFTQCWIAGTPNIPNNNYLIQYMQYADKSLGKRSLETYQGKFKNDSFRAIQQGYIAAEMYQSLKRIQRSPKPIGEFFIVNKDEELIKSILSQIKGASISETYEFKLAEKEEKTKTKIDMIADYITAQVALKQDKEHIEKMEVKNHFGSIRWDRVKSHPNVNELLQKGTLREQARYFVVFKQPDKAS